MYSYRMLMRVVELYRDGVRRSNEAVKAAAPIVGHLLTCRADRGIQVMKVVGSTGGPGGYGNIRVDILTPLMLPVLCGVSETGMVFRGTQRVCRGGILYEHLQAWWIRSMADPPENVITSDPHYHPECSRIIEQHPPPWAAAADNHPRTGAGLPGSA